MQDLSSKSKEELDQMARDRDIQGRSTMNRPELEQALEGHDEKLAATQTAAAPDAQPEPTPPPQEPDEDPEDDEDEWDDEDDPYEDEDDGVIAEQDPMVAEGGFDPNRPVRTSAPPAEQQSGVPALPENEGIEADESQRGPVSA